MDVRCERCQTEYELEDDSVSTDGTDVQCTTCGHTFSVKRPVVAPTALGFSAVGGSATTPAPASAEWLLETADAQVHRFRDLTALQKWIIERKVTRQDRISKTGQAWRKLGEIVELLPFFDVVDEADRAKAAAAEVAARGLKAQAADARRVGGGPRLTPSGGLSVEALMVGDGSRPSGTRSSEIQPVEAPAVEADIDTAVVRVRGGGRWKLLVSLGIAAGVAYLGITRLPMLVGMVPGGLATLGPPPATTPVASSATAPEQAPAVSPPATAEPAAQPVAAAAGAAPEATPPAAPAEAIAVAPPAVGQASAAAVAPKGAPAAPEPAASEPAAPAPAPVARAAKAADAGKEPSAVPEASYDDLVASADKALENGRANRALRLYTQALKQNPTGAEALAGMGYVNLDRQRAEAAVAYFRRALNVAPHAPAMFGMGEAYRALGDRPRAAEAYQKYLSTSPQGPDAPAARRQLKAVQSEPPAGETIPSPSTILQEGADKN